jgi:hypothetical protein
MAVKFVENKPIGFPQDHSSLRPYSNLFTGHMHSPLPTVPLGCNHTSAKQFDFVLITELEEIGLNSSGGATVFIIASPIHPGYRTYGQLRGRGVQPTQPLN